MRYSAPNSAPQKRRPKEQATAQYKRCLEARWFVSFGKLPGSEKRDSSHPDFFIGFFRPRDCAVTFGGMLYSTLLSSYLKSRINSQILKIKMQNPSSAIEQNSLRLQAVNLNPGT